MRLPAEADVATAAHVAANTIILCGAITWDAPTAGWAAQWGFANGDDAYAWRIAGVSFDGAFRSGLQGVAQVLSGHGAPE